MNKDELLDNLIRTVAARETRVLQLTDCEDGQILKLSAAIVGLSKLVEDYKDEVLRRMV